MGTRWNRSWSGGRVYEVDGHPVFVIEKMRHGRRYTTPLEVGSEREALAELALFERDPEGYLTRRNAAAERRRSEVRVDAESVARFLAWLRTSGRTERYRVNTPNYLAQWARVLAGRDLRAVSLQELKRTLSGWEKARTARIIALKSFVSYLRDEEGAISVAEDATLSLKVQASRPGKRLTERAYELRLVERTYAAIEVQAIRDLVCVLAKTGLHAGRPDSRHRSRSQAYKLLQREMVPFQVFAGTRHFRSKDVGNFQRTNKNARRSLS